MSPLRRSGQAAPVTIIGGVQVDVIMSPVTELPEPGASLLTDEMSLRLGGAAANAALALSETGVGARLLGAIGGDQLGTWMGAELARWGLADDLTVLPEGRSGLTVALQSPERDRTFLTYLGVYADWTPEMITARALECRELLLCDYFLLPGMRGSAARRLFDTAHRAGARTFLDTAWDPAGFSVAAREEVLQLLPAVDVFLPNEAEAAALAGSEPGTPEQSARALQAACGGWVVVKLGAAGALAAGPGGALHHAAAPQVQVADTTGAGDAFNAGLIAALNQGDPWPAALSRGAGLASEIVSRPSHRRYAPGRANC